MLSYRHAFHAGNHADVLKHMIAIQLMRYFGQKETPTMYIDTHAGAGIYALDTGYAAKNAEYANGIAKLWDRKDLPAPLKEYVDLVKALNPSGKMRYYPGSPYCADRALRPQDRIRLFELHPSDAKILEDNFRKLEQGAAASGQRPAVRGKRVMVEKGDGFTGLKALLPPPSRRGLVLIDPPYEVKEDYRRVRDTLVDALGRFPTGTYAVWYPVLQRMESRQMPEKLMRLPAQDWLNVTLSIRTPTPDGFGLHSSGMFILNPPWTLEPMLREVLPYLVSALGEDEGASFTLEVGEGGTPGKVRQPMAREVAAPMRDSRPGAGKAGSPQRPVQRTNPLGKAARPGSPSAPRRTAGTGKPPRSR
ncbi:23S rRNA (adenine2030-N6)-methyltransferase [Noviherbaspirillum humi]|uniref:Ribosomal RNA large subunit methyltransferase J n=1 Tax=Noviherbaspirillum humi TaxID=1688639 RepID=A0A239D6Y1_9BURK|nr:23S rRNA (adenine2030-N6)-methyltransferase [Noviherbaspirillum humi]